MTTYTYQQLVNDPALAAAFDPLLDVLDLQAVATAITVKSTTAGTLFFHPALSALELPISPGQFADSAGGDDNLAATSGQLVIGDNTTDGTVDFLANAFTAGTTAVHFLGLAGNDSFTGGVGDDLAYGNRDNDSLAGGDGADSLYGGQGFDAIDGGNGADLIYGNLDGDTLAGAGGNDLMFGGQGDDRVLAGGGDDHAYGNRGSDTLMGQSGADHLYGGQGADLLDGGGGDDLAYGNMAADTIAAGDGMDTVFGGQGDDLVLGGGDNDILRGNRGSDTLAGGTGNDLFLITAGNGDDVDMITDLGPLDGIRITGVGVTAVSAVDTHTLISLGSGDRILVVNTGIEHTQAALAIGRADAVVAGGPGADTLVGTAGHDWIDGGTGNDLLFGRTGNDTLIGDMGSDTIYGEAGADSIVNGAVAFGGDGNDVLVREIISGSESLHGGGGDDRIRLIDDPRNVFSGPAMAGVRADGGAGNDTIACNGYSTLEDVIVGGDGSDSLWAGLSLDRVFAGGGDDVILANAHDVQIATGTGADIIRPEILDLARQTTITDFAPATDRIDLDAAFDAWDAKYALGGPPVDRAAMINLADSAAGNTVITFDGGEAVIIVVGVNAATLADSIWLGAY